MNIQNRALVIAAGVGAVIQAVLSLISSYASFQGTASTLADPSTGLPALDPATLTGTSLISTLVCCCIILIDVGIGGLYAYLHKQQAPVDVQDGLAGGAAAAAIARLVSGFVGACATLLLLPTILSGQDLGFGLAGGMIGSLVGICMGVVFGAVLGAIGGAVGAALFNRS